MAGRGAYGWRNIPWSIWLLIGLCTGIEGLLTGADIGLWSDADLRLRAYQMFAFWGDLLQGAPADYRWQPVVMFLSYGFLHGGGDHLLMNVLGLLAIGTPLARKMGDGRFLLVYGALTIAGGIGFALARQGAIPMVGASGAIFGLLGIQMAWAMRGLRRRGLPVMPVLKTVAMLALLNVALYFVTDGQLAWQTHLGGFVGGWLIARFL